MKARILLTALFISSFGLTACAGDPWGPNADPDQRFNAIEISNGSLKGAIAGGLQLDHQTYEFADYYGYRTDVLLQAEDSPLFAMLILEIDGPMYALLQDGNELHYSPWDSYERGALHMNVIGCEGQDAFDLYFDEPANDVMVSVNEVENNRFELDITANFHTPEGFAERYVAETTFTMEPSENTY